MFHAFSLSRLYAITKTFKTPPPPEDMALLASRAVLAALCIPPANPVVDINLLEYDLEHEKKKRMAQMLNFPTTASRNTLLSDISAKGLSGAPFPSPARLPARLPLPSATLFDVHHRRRIACGA